jgi:hypothetical protein
MRYGNVEETMSRISLGCLVKDGLMAMKKRIHAYSGKEGEQKTTLSPGL